MVICRRGLHQPMHRHLLPLLQLPHHPLPVENNTISTVNDLSISNHLKLTLLQPKRSDDPSYLKVRYSSVTNINSVLSSRNRANRFHARSHRSLHGDPANSACHVAPAQCLPTAGRPRQARLRRAARYARVRSPRIRLPFLTPPPPLLEACTPRCSGAHFYTFANAGVSTKPRVVPANSNQYSGLVAAL